MQEECKIKRGKFIKHIEFNHSFFLFASFDIHNIELFNQLKMEIDEEIKNEGEKNKFKLN